ncbi:MAG: hypothetical protein HY023_10415 [Chloroflexi bacterium]|nr:hypothetical protein [Chloroflexota bacterium]
MSAASNPPPVTRHSSPKDYVRFTLTERIEHAILLISFTMLAATGLPQKFADASISQAMIALFGGIEFTRQIHHWAAIVLMAGAIFHIVAAAYRVYVIRRPLAMLPLLEDFVHLWQKVRYDLGLGKSRPRFGRYSYDEKVEYLAVVWGTLIMILTGFFMWNPIATARVLPGDTIPAAKAAHGAEAVLAVLAIILWHFYNVHLKRFNKSMFTGRLSEEEMLHEHPEELALIKAGVMRPPDRQTIRKRERAFIPAAAVFVAVVTVGLIQFVTFEQTAITTVPPGETAPIFAPQTPTPSPIPPSPSPPVEGSEGGTPEPVSALTWEAYVGPLFSSRCSACHGSIAGLSFGTYADALKGSANGPVIVPGEAEGSKLVVKQSQGNHPGQLSGEELAKVKEWIANGAPEK